jgi:hypothetical protein
MNEFFVGYSVADRGTLFHMKNVFRWNSLKKNVMSNFNICADFTNFYTQGLLCLLVMDQLGLDSLDGVPVRSKSAGNCKKL